MSPPEILLGSGVWGHFVNEDEIRKQIAVAGEFGILHIDSGAHHPYSKPGLAEVLLGKARFKGMIVDSKVLYVNGGDGTLTAEAVRDSIDTTLASLKIEKLHTYYALAPDRTTPLADQAAAFDVQYRLGKFTQLGICNFQPDMLEKWIEISQEHGYVRPTVFQGQYNLLCRGYELRLFPLLRKHGISFNAFGVLAGGILTGKLTFSQSVDDLKGTRFEVSGTNVIGVFGRKWYDKPSFHNAVRRIVELCKPHEIDIADAVLRWTVHHSLLDGEKGDAIIIGPRNSVQLAQNIHGLHDGPLPGDLVQAFDSLWNEVKDDASELLIY